MSYLDDFKQKVEDEKQSRVESYKTFMEEVVLQEIIQSVNATAIVTTQDLINNEINCDKFEHWLREEGFNVATTHTTYIITLEQ